MEQEEDIAAGSANLYKHSENQQGGFLESWKPQDLAMPHSWAYTQKMLQHLTTTLAQLC